MLFHYNQHAMHCLSIIFDLDGTLLDTLQDIAATANAVLVRYGFPVHSLYDYKRFVGDGLKALIEKITPPGTGENIINGCCQLFLQLYAKNWQNTCHPYDGIEDMLVALRKQRLKMAVLSNKPHVFTKLFIDTYFPGQPFAYTYGQREGSPKKPDPTVALELAERLATPPEKMLFVGDTAIDIRTGKAAGMTTVAVTWGFRNLKELEKENPDLIINSPMELLQHALSLA